MPAEHFNCPHCRAQLTKSAQAYVLGEMKQGMVLGPVAKTVTCPGCGGHIDAQKMVRGDYDAKACFVATAVYGDPAAPNVQALRAFRDRRLARSGAGRALISAYEKAGPVAARAIARRPRARRLARLLLDSAAAAARRLT